MLRASRHCMVERRRVVPLGGAPIGGRQQRPIAARACAVVVPQIVPGECCGVQPWCAVAVVRVPLGVVRMSARARRPHAVAAAARLSLACRGLAS